MTTTLLHRAYATTAYTDVSGLQLRDIGSRTDSSGTPLANDVNPAEDRMIHSLFSPGVLDKAADTFKVIERGAGANMSVDVGAIGDTALLDHVDGLDNLQGSYLVATNGVVNLLLTASDPTNPRIDEIYLVVQDNAYDSSGIATGRFSVPHEAFPSRDGLGFTVGAAA